MSGSSSTPKRSSVPTGTGGVETDHGKSGLESTTEAPWERGKLLQKDTGRLCPLGSNGSGATWEEIASWLSDEEGRRIRHQTVQRAFESTLRRLAEKILEDRFLRQYLIDNNFTIPEEDS